MNRVYGYALTGVLLFSIAGIFSMTTAETDRDKVLAVIGDEKITVAEVEERISKLPPQQQTMYESEENRENLVKELIRLKLFSREARDKGWHKDPAFKSRLKAAEDALLAMDYVKRNVLRVEVSERDLEKFFTQNKAGFNVPETIKLSSIYIDAVREVCPNDASEKKNVADKIYRFLKQGGEFSEVQKQYGKLVKVETNSDYFARGRLIPQLEDIAFALKPGELSQVIETKEGFAIFRMEDRKPSRPQVFAEVKDEIREKLKERRIKEKFKQIDIALFDKYKVSLVSQQQHNKHETMDISQYSQ